MKRDEIWLGLCLCAILTLSGFFDPVIEKITEKILNTPLYPKVTAFAHSEREAFRDWETASPLFQRRIFTRNQPSTVSTPSIPSRKVPAREELPRG